MVRALRLVGLEGSLGSFLRHLPMAYGRVAVGAVSLPILGLSLLLFYKLSRTMRGFVRYVLISELIRTACA